MPRPRLQLAATARREKVQLRIREQNFFYTILLPPRAQLCIRYCSNLVNTHTYKTKITPTKAGEEHECQRTAEVKDPSLTASTWES
jgi:hypothetical protein